MNLKIILQLPEKLKDSLDKIANDLYDDYKGIYVKKEQFYITLRDLNNVDSFTQRQVKSALTSISSKSDPFILYCNELMLLNPKRKSPMVYSLRGLTSKLYNLHQNLENALYTRGIQRDNNMPFPNIEIAKKVAYKQLPYTKSPQIPIEVGSIYLIEQKRRFLKLEYSTIQEFPLFGGHLYVVKIEEENVICTNSCGKEITLDILDMPNDLKEKDVIIKTGTQYIINKSETRIRTIQEQIKNEKRINIQNDKKKG